mgnify:CR=1 FL=1
MDCIIQLPANLFFGTNIATCIMVMKKGKKDNNILFIDASDQCIKAINNNRLSVDNIDAIVSTFTKRENVQYICRLVSYDEVKAQNYNLSVSTYVEQEEKRVSVDINTLNEDIENIVKRGNDLREAVNQISRSIDGGKIYG